MHVISQLQLPYSHAQPGLSPGTVYQVEWPRSTNSGDTGILALSLQ